MKDNTFLYESIIKQCFKNFKLFSGNSTLPNFGIKWYDSDKDEIDFYASFDAPMLYKKNYILKVDKSIFRKYKNEKISSILYHEFIHLSDALEFGNKDFNEFKYIMTTYSEYHAAKIEMMKLIGLSSIDEKHDIDLKGNIIYHSARISIADFIEQNFNKCNNFFRIRDNNPIPENFVKDMRFTLYLLGYISITNVTINKYKYKIKIFPEDIKGIIFKLFEVLNTKNLEKCIEYYNEIKDYYLDVQMRISYRNDFTVDQLSDEDLLKITHKNHKEIADTLIKY